MKKKSVNNVRCILCGIPLIYRSTKINVLFLYENIKIFPLLRFFVRGTQYYTDDVITISSSSASVTGAAGDCNVLLLGTLETRQNNNTRIFHTSTNYCFSGLYHRLF